MVSFVRLFVPLAGFVIVRVKEKSGAKYIGKVPGRFLDPALDEWDLPKTNRRKLGVT